MGEEKEKIKELLYGMTNRIEKLEKTVEGLVEEERAASKDKFKADKEYFRKRLERF